MQGAVWGLTGIIKIRADDEERRERAECEKAKLTQTFSITFHLTLSDDNVDTADNGRTRQPDVAAGLPVNSSVKHQGVEGLALTSTRDVWRRVVFLKPQLKKSTSHFLYLLVDFFFYLTVMSEGGSG